MELKVDELINDDELKAVLAGKKEREIASKLLLPLTSRINALAEARAAKKLEEELGKFQKEAEIVLKAELEKIRKANTPPTPEEMQALLSQEYIEFKVRIRDSSREREFVIRELPLNVEIKVLKQIQNTLSSRLREISTMQWDPGSTMIERIEAILGVVPGAMETLADCVAICLDPFGQEKIDGTWVQTNMGMPRIMAVVRAQIHVGRYRDFVSGVSQLTSSTTL